MKKFVTAIVAAALLAPVVATPALADPGHDRGRHNDWNNHPDRQWRQGERFDYRYAPNYAVIDYRHHRGLRPPPRGYRWVRSGNDAVLVAIGTGVIASIIAGSFN